VFKKQNFTLGPDTIAFLDDVCTQYDVPGDQLEAAVQYFVDEYAKQDGMARVDGCKCFLDMHTAPKMPL
jgi:hypothetical protein